MLFKIITYRRWKKFWETAFQWFSDKFDAVASSIDFTPIEEKIDALDEKVSPYLYPECSDADIDHMFEPVNADGQIIIPSGLITPEGTMPISVFKAITGLTPTE